MRYWFCITTPANWERVKEHLVWGVEERYEITMKRLTLDDPLVMYVTSPAKAIAGIYKVASRSYFDEKPLGWSKPYPHRVKIHPLVVPPSPIQIDERLIEELLYITDKSKRGRTVFFFPSMVLLIEEDFRTMYNWLEQKMKF